MRGKARRTGIHSWLRYGIGFDTAVVKGRALDLCQELSLADGARSDEEDAVLQNLRELLEYILNGQRTKSCSPRKVKRIARSVTGLDLHNEILRFDPKRLETGLTATSTRRDHAR
jgi:hypothetical protein